MLLQLNNLVCGYKNGFSTKPLTLSTPVGSVTGLVGPNGAGKSTLLKTMLGLQVPLSGSVLWHHHYQFSYLPQINAVSSLLPMTVAEVLGEENFEDPFQISSLLDESFHSLSGGQKQRVLITRAFLKKPDVVFLDEPVNHVDEETTKLFWNFIEGLQKNKKLSGLFIIDHDRERLVKYVETLIEL